LVSAFSAGGAGLQDWARLEGWEDAWKGAWKDAWRYSTGSKDTWTKERKVI